MYRSSLRQLASPARAIFGARGHSAPTAFLRSGRNFASEAKTSKSAASAAAEPDETLQGDAPFAKASQSPGEILNKQQREFKPKYTLPENYLEILGNGGWEVDDENQLIKLHVATKSTRQALNLVNSAYMMSYSLNNTFFNIQINNSDVDFSLSTQLPKQDLFFMCRSIMPLKNW